MRSVVIVALALLLSACSGVDGSTDEQPPSPGSSTSRTTPAPDLEPTVDVEPLPSPSGWSPRPQSVDDDAEPDTPWATERDVEEAMAIWASYACIDRSALPTPVRVLEGAFTTDRGDEAVVEVIEFAAEAEATSFGTDYTQGSLDCGTARRVADNVLARDIAELTWTEILVPREQTLTLVIISTELSAEEAEDVANSVR